MKPQHDYTNIDSAIFADLKIGSRTFTQLKYQHGNVKKEAEILEAKEKTFRTPGFQTPAFRFIDRRLQALRKNGKITYSTKSGWSIVENGGEA